MVVMGEIKVEIIDIRLTKCRVSDVGTGNTVEVTAHELMGILNKGDKEGDLPHATYKLGGVHGLDVTLTQNHDSKRHQVLFNIRDVTDELDRHIKQAEANEAKKVVREGIGSIRGMLNDMQTKRN